MKYIIDKLATYGDVIYITSTGKIEETVNDPVLSSPVAFLTETNNSWDKKTWFKHDWIYLKYTQWCCEHNIDDICGPIAFRALTRHMTIRRQSSGFEMEFRIK